MKNIGIIHSLKGIFQRKHHSDRHENVFGKRNRNDVFSYSIGAPDDELTKEAFRMLREMKRKETGKGHTDKDGNEPEA